MTWAHADMPSENSGVASPELETRSKFKSRFELFSHPLPTEAELMATWADRDEIVVSIACATFEHGALLDDAIRSFLLQKTDFRFEIVIRDDASTDGTREVIAHYIQQYPRIVRARIYDENQFKLGRRPADDWAELTNGKYIALCEGDDFWIDSDKLQDQIAQLERYTEAVISVGGTFWYNVSDGSVVERGMLESEAIISSYPRAYFHTSTIVVLRDAFVDAKVKQRKFGMYGDVALRHLLLEYGKCVCLPRVVSVYWVNEKGIWSSLSEGDRSKDRVRIAVGLFRAVGHERKITYFGRMLRACAAYFPEAVRRKDWRFAFACGVPFAVVKMRNLQLRTTRKVRPRD